MHGAGRRRVGLTHGSEAIPTAGAGPLDGPVPASVYSTAMKRLLRTLTLGVVCSGLGLWLACDSATPTAPSGTILTITASPSQIGLNGTSQITVIGRRPDGNPLNPGTEIFFSTSLGSVSPTVTTVDDDGVARATLRGDGRPGTANVTASVSTTTGGGGAGGGGGEGGGGGGGGPTTGVGTTSTSVLIGNDPDQQPTVLVSASPSTIFVEETSEVTVVARASDGSPLAAGERVILTSTLGEISPDRPVIGNDGTATATLLAGKQPGTAEIRAIVGSAEPATTTVTIQDTVSDVSITITPDSIPESGGTIELMAFVINSQGTPVPGRQVTFDTQVGDTDPDVVSTDNQGRAATTITVTDQELDVFLGPCFHVSAQAGTGGGNFETAREVVEVEGRDQDECELEAE